MAPPSHRSWRARAAGGAVRLVEGTLLGLAIQLTNHVVPLSLTTDITAAGSYLCGLLFGPAGVAGQAALALVRDGGGRHGSPVEVAAAAVAGLIAWLAFRTVRASSRAFDNMATLRLFPMTAAFAALAYSTSLALETAGAISVPNVTVRWASAFAGTCLLVPPLSHVLRRLGEPWITPMGGRGDTRHRPEALDAARLRTLAACAFSVVALAAFFGFWQPRVPGVFAWLAMLLSIPVLYAVSVDGSRAGVLLGPLAGLAYLISGLMAVRSRDGWLLTVVSRQAAAVLFPGIAAVLGLTRDRERRLMHELEEANDRLRNGLHTVVHALHSAVGARDAYTEGHMRRVCSFALRVGEKLGMTEEDLVHLEAAAMLHDVGKIGIPEAILHKPAPLTPEEREVMEKHPEIGARICREVRGLEQAARIVRHHQERWDGRREGKWRGYPDGLAGDQIPIGARIIAVVDTFDAMTSNRAYRPAMSHEEAIAELVRESGHQFDPRAVGAFLEALGESSWR